MAKYNEKQFLLPDSEHSMASIHAKIQDDGIYKLTIHDCKGSIQLWGDLKTKEGIAECREKLENLTLAIWDFSLFIDRLYPIEVKPETTKLQLYGNLNTITRHKG